MPNIANVLKAEITRLARKEVRDEVDGLRKASAVQRSEIAALKRRVQALESTIKRLSKTLPAAAPARVETVADDEGGRGLRFRAAGMAANRKRLGLSAADFGLLVGATGQSIYGWESGNSKPRQQAVAAIAALRGVGKREVAERLVAIKTASAPLVTTLSRR
jgi:DNA-binding transcriptional regulator YiaG